MQFIEEVEHRKKENKIHTVKSTSNIFFLGLVLVMKFIIILIYNTQSELEERNNILKR